MTLIKITKLAVVLAISQILSSSCSKLEYDINISLNEVELGTHVYGPKVTLGDLQNKVVVIQYWDHHFDRKLVRAKSLVELQEKYGHDDLVVIVIFDKNVFPGLEEIRSKNYKPISKFERHRRNWEQAGGTDVVSMFDDVELLITGYSTTFGIFFNSEGEQIWNGGTGFNDNPLNPDLIEAVDKAVKRKNNQ